MISSKKTEKKRQLLKDLLTGKVSSLEFRRLSELIRYDLLSEIIKENPGREDFFRQKYLSNTHIKDALNRLYSEIIDEKSPRQTFGPGTFMGFQGQLNCIILTKKVIEHELKWTMAEVVQKINYKVLYDYKLRCTKSCFKHLYNLLIEIYPDENLKPYYFRKASSIWIDKNGMRNDSLIKEAIREFICILTDPKGKHKYKFKDIPRWINYKMFRKPILPHQTNLSYLLSSCFGNSHIKAIMFAYPELNLKPYYFSNVPNKYWSGEKGLEHAKELMTELMDILTNPKGKYKLTKEEVKELFKFKTYGKPILPYKKNMRGMLQTIFKNSPSAPFKLLFEERDG